MEILTCFNAYNQEPSIKGSCGCSPAYVFGCVHLLEQTRHCGVIWYLYMHYWVFLKKTKYHNLCENVVNIN